MRSGDQQKDREALVRLFERDKRFSIAMTVVWVTVAALATALIFALTS
jgi:hypothetical protein